MELDKTAISVFQHAVWGYYQAHGRHDLPWRQPEADGRFDPYKIVLSEVMLQQTQVPRVIPKYHEFLHHFPTAEALAQAELGAVLRVWSGLGYNRRAKYLWQTAQKISDDFHSTFPKQLDQLITLPGIGKNTAGAILTYAFNQSAVFIETNVRTVFIHHFFQDQTDIPDVAILELISQTLDAEDPRSWYWALMDYGAYLKQTVGNLNRASKGYAKQSKFHGSRRQVRGQVLRLLAEQALTKEELEQAITDERLSEVLRGLLKEGMLRKQGTRYLL